MGERQSCALNARNSEPHQITINHQKRKENYAPIIIASFCQCNLHRRRIGPRAHHRRCRSIASLIDWPFRANFNQIRSNAGFQKLCSQRRYFCRLFTGFSRDNLHGSDMIFRQSSKFSTRHIPKKNISESMNGQYSTVKFLEHLPYNLDSDQECSFDKSGTAFSS
jgi:hypothetical protein